MKLHQSSEQIGKLYELEHFGLKTVLFYSVFVISMRMELFQRGMTPFPVFILDKLRSRSKTDEVSNPGKCGIYRWNPHQKINE